MSDLRPMEFGEVLDGAFTMFRRNFGLFFKLSVAISAVPAALFLYLQFRFSGATPDQSMAVLQTHVGELVGLGLLWAVLAMCAKVMLTAGAIHVISASYLGRPATLGEALRLGASKIVPLILVGLGKWLLVFIIYIVGAVIWVLLAGVGGMAGPVAAVVVVVVGFIGLVWFLAFVLSGYALTTPAVVLEELNSSFDAFGRSWDLTRSHKLKVFGLWLVAWFLTWCVPILFFFFLGLLVSLRAPSLQLPLVVVNTVVSIALAGALPCVYTLMYYDLRMRREGFDLQLLGQQLGIG
jgi:hypothetical protein